MFNFSQTGASWRVYLYWWSPTAKNTHLFSCHIVIHRWLTAFISKPCQCPGQLTSTHCNVVLVLPMSYKTFHSKLIEIKLQVNIQSFAYTAKEPSLQKADAKIILCSEEEERAKEAEKIYSCQHQRVWCHVPRWYAIIILWRQTFFYEYTISIVLMIVYLLGWMKYPFHFLTSTKMVIISLCFPQM